MKQLYYLYLLSLSWEGNIQQKLKTTQVIPTRHIVSTSTIEDFKFLECKSIVHPQFFYDH